MNIPIIAQSHIAPRSHGAPQGSDAFDKSLQREASRFVERLGVIARFALIVLTIGVTITPLRVEADEWALGGGPIHGSDGCAMAELQSLSTYGPQPYVFGCSMANPPNTTLFNANGTCINPPACTEGAGRGGLATLVSCDQGYSSLNGGPGCVTTPPPKMCPTTGKPADSAPTGGEPIIIASGQLVEHAVDYESAGPFPLRVERFYLSNPWTNMFLNALVSPSPWIPASGGTWRTNFDASVQWSVGGGSNSAPQYVYVALPDGHQAAFMSPNSDGTYTPAIVNSSGVVSSGGKGVDRRQRQLGVGRDLHALRDDGLCEPEPDGDGYQVSGAMVPAGDRAGV
jgi:hypothetical protein